MNITDEQINKAKRLNLPDLFRNTNINLIPTNNGSSFKCLCPFHDDKDPSLNINFKDNIWLWNCFGCGAGGTAIDFIMKRNNSDFKQAVKSLIPQTEYITKNPVAKKPEQNDSNHSDNLLSMVMEHYHKILTDSNIDFNTKSRINGKTYLKKRGLFDPANEVFKKHRVILREKYGLFKINYHETFAHCVVFPVFDLKGNTTDLYARRTMNYTDRANHCYNKGKHQGIFNIKNVINAESIILTEGIIDALSIYKSGFKNVTALYGTNGFTKAHEKLFNNGITKEIIFALDNDTAGKRAIETLTKKLNHLKIKVVILPKGIKDFNELLVTKGTEVIQQTLNNSELLSLNPENLSSSASKFQFKDKDLIFKTDLISYQIRNVSNLKNLDSLRFVITACSENQSYTDRIDLYLSKSRKLFESAISKGFNIQPAVIEADLLELQAFIETDYANRIKSKDNSSETKELTELERAEALNFLKSDNLIKQILNDITTLGYIGEDENKLLLYLGATSRLLDKAISILIRSQSSSGKSYLIKLICSLLPSEDVHKWTKATQQALYYMEKDALKHKFVAIDEREGMEDAEYPIRSLQSEGVITLSVPIKNPTTGQTVTEIIIKEGPISYVDGSTDTRTNPENANRCFEMYLDESALQTINIHLAQKGAYNLDGLVKSLLNDEIKRKHQNAQRLLKPLKVIIPYVHEIEFPIDFVRTRRDHDRFLLLISVITFLHQYQRPIKEHHGIRYIESNLKDYEIAYKIASVVIFNTFQELEKPVFDFYLLISKMVEKEAKKQSINLKEYYFTRRSVRSFTKLPDYLVKRYMRTLTDLEYLNVKGGKQGSRFSYRLTRNIKKKDKIEGLLTPNELHQKLKKKQNASQYDKKTNVDLQ